MKLQLIITGIAGVLTSFTLPLPHHEPVSRAAVKPAAALRRMVRPVAAVAERDWPKDAAFIATLSANECGAALDRILRHCACTLPDGETLDAAVALTMRLTDLSAAENRERNPFRGRRLPAWLLHGATGSYLQRSPIPPAGWMAAVARSAEGRGVMTGLTADLAVSSPDKAKTLAAACPAEWRPALNVKLREGLAVRDPVAAAREAWEASIPWDVIKRDGPQSVLMISSRRGPVKESVAAIALYGDGGADDSQRQRMLANLLLRDSAATRAAVEESGDPVLQRHLKKAEQLPPEGDAPPRSPAQLTEQFADPEKAFQWTKANAPRELISVFNTWVQADGPAALQAVWTLPRDNPLRETVERIARVPEEEFWAQYDYPALRGYNELMRLAHGTSLAEIRAAVRYVKLPEDDGPHGPYPPRAPGEVSPLWSDGPISIK